MENISSQYPKDAIRIWQVLAENEIARTKPSAYDEAKIYLKKAKKLFLAIGGKSDWDVYLAALKEANKRKSRLIQTLRGLEREKIASK